jgi:hypothetical protein
LTPKAALKGSPPPENELAGRRSMKAVEKIGVSATSDSP